jgi:catechol 2,3-dioxygenase-like lactoylglutathione lyase family enzyme
MLESSFTETQVHHVALRVADASASKAWFLTKLRFHVDREFSFAGKDFVWLRPTGSGTPVIELIGGGMTKASRPSYANALDSVAHLGFHHICLRVVDLDQLVTELRRSDVKILIEVMEGAPGTGIAKAAFIADPWDNILELVELGRRSAEPELA